MRDYLWTVLTTAPVRSNILFILNTYFLSMTPVGLIMKTMKMKLLLGAALPALFLAGCTAEGGGHVASISDVIKGKNAVKISSSESLLGAEKGLWDLYEQEDEIDPVALHKMARAKVNPSDKSKKTFLSEQRLAMAAGARSGRDQNNRIIRVARANDKSDRRTDVVMMADASATNMPVPALKKPVFAPAKVEQKAPAAMMVAEAAPRREPIKSLEVKEVVFGGRNNQGARIASTTSAAQTARSPVEFVAAANTPKPQAKPAGSFDVASSDAEVEQMRLGEHPDKTRLVLDLSGAVNYRTEIDARGKFLTVELPHAGWRTKTRSALQSALIAGYTAEPSEGGQGTRLKLELKKPVKIIGAAALRPDHGKPHRIYFDIGAA